MNTRSGRSQIIKHNYTKIYILTAVLCLLAALAVTLTVLHFVPLSGSTTTDETTPTSDESPETESVTVPETAKSTEEESEGGTETEEPSGAIEYIEMTPAQMTAGNPLTVVNSAHPFSGKTPLLADVFKDRETRDGVKLSLARSSMYLASDAMKAFEELNFRLVAQYPEFSLLVTSACESDNLNVSCPDSVMPESEHATGYAIDARFAKTTKDEKTGETKSVGIQFYDVAGANQCAFLLEEAAKLGIVQSKANTPGHKDADLRHLRYVGIPHAQYIYENKLSPEDYIEALKAYNFNKRLTLAGENVRYEIYYVKSAGDTTNVPVPVGSTYEILGNGIDGFIVTLTVASEVTPAAED